MASWEFLFDVVVAKQVAGLGVKQKDEQKDLKL